MFEFGTTREDFAAIAMAFRDHATRNPEAVMRKPLTLQAYLDARLIVDPFALYDCSLVSDGAGAVVVTSMERARALKSKPVAIKGFGTFNNTKGWFLDDHMVSTAAAESAQQAYRMAGLGPKDIDTAQIYDCLPTWCSRSQEDYGCKGRGRRVRALRRWRSAAISDQYVRRAVVGGAWKECSDRRRRPASCRIHDEGRQVRDAEIALVSGHGGNTVCHSTLILGKA